MQIRRAFQPLLWLTLALSLALLLLSLLGPNARLEAYTSASPLRLTGVYAVDGAAERLPFTGEQHIPVAANRQLVVSGHFDRDVLPNTQIILRICNLTVRLRVNGQEVFAFGERKPSFGSGGGNVWMSFTTAGITAADDVELTLTSVYGSASRSSFDAFFNHLSAGSEYPVYRAAFVSQAVPLGAGILIFLLGAAMLGVSFYARALGLARSRDYPYLSAFVIVSGVWMCINYQYASLVIPYPAFIQLLEMVCMLWMPVFLMRYMVSLVPATHRAVCRWTVLAVLAAALLGLGLQFMGAVDLAALTGVFALVDVAAISVFAVCLLRGIKPRTPEMMVAVAPLFILFAGALLNVANYFLVWQTGGLFFSLALLAYSLLELSRLIRSLRDSIRRSREYARLENELTQSRIAVMLSQIKPHFLFNALNSISALCLTDPIMADQAITSLSNYLRGNIRSLEQSAPVPFEQELDHIKYYVRLEQLRYGDKLRVVYAIETTDFVVPTLSLQTLVENAIRHGVSPRPEGGLVVVQTERADGGTLVRIIDDGVGFDPDMQSRNADSIGLANAKKRMEAMVGAVFEIRSVPGKGTAVEIRIPDAPGKERA
ncbi:MAG: histidine kinase [Clostridiales bacterium]|nr:histidine kinase [Clostridiales bacterium]